MERILDANSLTEAYKTNLLNPIDEGSKKTFEEESYKKFHPAIVASTALLMKQRGLAHYPQKNAQYRLNATALTMLQNIDALKVKESYKLSQTQLEALVTAQVKEPNFGQWVKDKFNAKFNDKPLDHTARENLEGMGLIKASNTQYQAAMSWAITHFTIPKN